MQDAGLASRTTFDSPFETNFLEDSLLWNTTRRPTTLREDSLRWNTRLALLDDSSRGQPVSYIYRPLFRMALLPVLLVPAAVGGVRDTVHPDRLAGSA